MGEICKVWWRAWVESIKSTRASLIDLYMYYKGLTAMHGVFEMVIWTNTRAITRSGVGR